MSLDLSSALRDAADHAPLGMLEPSALGRRIRRRRTTRTAARTVGGVGLAGALAFTATQTPALLDRYARTVPGGTEVTGLPADQVATTLPAADPAAAPGECGWTVQAPVAPSVYRLGVALGSYPEQTYSSMPVVVSVRLADEAPVVSSVRVVAARDGVVVAAALDTIGWGTDRTGLSSASAGDFLSLLSCGGPDEGKTLPDGDYSVYAVHADPGTGELVALSPAEPLVVVGNAREQWCGADASVIPGSDGRLDVSGAVDAGGSVELEVAWSGVGRAELLDQRVLLVDEASGRIVADSRAPAGSETRVGAEIAPGEPVAFSLTEGPDGCGDGPPPSGTYGAVAVVTVAPPAAQELATNATGVGELVGTVTVP